MNIANNLPRQEIAAAESDCCPLIKPIDYDGKLFDFKDKMFVRVRTINFLHIPLNMSMVMRRAVRKISESDADVDPEDYIMLSDEVSPWYSYHYIAVSDEVPGLKTQEISGKFLAKVFEGPFKDAEKWYEELIDYTFASGYEPIKTLFYYTTCPKCAKKYGKNYVVGFEQVE